MLSLNPLVLLKTCPVGADDAIEPEGIVTVSGILGDRRASHAGDAGERRYSRAVVGYPKRSRGPSEMPHALVRLESGIWAGRTSETRSVCLRRGSAKTGATLAAHRPAAHAKHSQRGRCCRRSTLSSSSWRAPALTAGCMPHTDRRKGTNTRQRVLFARDYAFNLDFIPFNLYFVPELAVLGLHAGEKFDRPGSLQFGGFVKTEPRSSTRPCGHLSHP